MRNMDYIGISQSIGRVIRLGTPGDFWSCLYPYLRHGWYQHRQESAGSC